MNQNLLSDLDESDIFSLCCIDRDEILKLLKKDSSKLGVDSELWDEKSNFVSSAYGILSRKYFNQLVEIVNLIEKTINHQDFQSIVMAEAPFIAREPQASRGGLLCYDFHLTSSGFKLIEINSNAGGAWINLLIKKQILESIKSHQDIFNGDIDAEISKNINVFIEDFSLACNNNKLQTVWIVDEDIKNQNLYIEFLLYQSFLKSFGIHCELVNIEDLGEKFEKISAKEKESLLIYNRLTDFYFENDKNKYIKNIYENKKSIVTPHPYVYALYADKINLNIFSNIRERLPSVLSEKEFKLFEQVIPKTYLINSFQDSNILWNKRKDFIFKPARSYGSKGVYRGDKITQKVFNSILKQDFLVQEFIPPSEHLILNHNESASFKLDFRCYTYAGEIILMTSRIYHGQVTNFKTPGGGFAPVFIK